MPSNPSGYVEGVATLGKQRRDEVLPRPDQEMVRGHRAVRTFAVTPVPIFQIIRHVAKTLRQRYHQGSVMWVTDSYEELV
jgi:hypothetical protein